MEADLVHGEDHDGQHYFPPGCDNDHIQANHCIGKDQCPYSIWGSLPFPQEMYDQVGDSEADGYDGF